jgi:hypothetical protein
MVGTQRMRQPLWDTGSLCFLVIYLNFDRRENMEMHV